MRKTGRFQNYLCIMVFCHDLINLTCTCAIGFKILIILSKNDHLFLDYDNVCKRVYI